MWCAACARLHCRLTRDLLVTAMMPAVTAIANKLDADSDGEVTKQEFTENWAAMVSVLQARAQAVAPATT